VVSHPSTIVA